MPQLRAVEPKEHLSYDYVHEFEHLGVQLSEFSSALQKDVASFGGCVINTWQNGSTVHVMVGFASREQAQSFVRGYYTEAGASDVEIALMVDDIHEI